MGAMRKYARHIAREEMWKRKIRNKTGYMRNNWRKLFREKAGK